MIPKLLHQSTSDVDNLRFEIKDNISLLKKNNPGWRYSIYDNSEQLAYIKSNITLGLYRRLEKVNPKYSVIFSDIFRYLLMFNEGGVYLDDKSTSVHPLDTAVPKESTYLLSHWRNGYGQPYQGWGMHGELGDPRIGGEFQQWFIVARPHHPFLRAVVLKCLENIENYRVENFGVGKIGVLRLTGPICYTKTILEAPQADFQRIDIASIGFRYTVFDQEITHAGNSNHYRFQEEPIVFS